MGEIFFKRHALFLHVVFRNVCPTAANAYTPLYTFHRRYVKAFSFHRKCRGMSKLPGKPLVEYHRYSEKDTSAVCVNLLVNESTFTY